MKPNLKVYPRTDLKNAAGQNPIYLRLTFKRKRKYYSLGCSVPDPSKYWDQVNRKIKRYPGSNYKVLSEANQEIEMHYNKALGILHGYLLLNRPFTFDDFDQAFRMSDKIKTDFYAFAETQIHLLQQKQASKETIRSYNSYVSKLKAYRGHLSFSDINLSFLRSYHNYMLNDLHNMENTCYKSLAFIRTMLHRAINEGIIDDNIFRKYSLTKTSGKRDFLTLDELKTLDDLFHSGSLKKYQANVLRYFLFSCYTGLRYQDVKDLKHRDLIEESHSLRTQLFIRIHMHKTKESISIPVINKARVLIMEGFDNQRVFRVACNQVTNRYLKEISEVSGIIKSITFHSARHTFATSSISPGMPIEVVSKLLGHKDLKTTMIYSKIVDDIKIHYMDRWNTLSDPSLVI